MSLCEHDVIVSYDVTGH